MSMDKATAGAKPRIVLIGAVNSTEVTLKKLAEHQLDVVGVFGYESENTDHVSGYVNLSEMSLDNNFKYCSFRNINTEADSIRALEPDYIFVVGLSQLVSRDILDIPTVCCIGFHPTLLPRGRGRAPLAWLIIDQQREGAASFFKLAEGVDDGPIVAQKDYLISEKDDVVSLVEKVLSAMELALDELLPKLAMNNVDYKVQDQSVATYYEKRTPDDGLIDWHCSVDQISRLIRATASPYPGAYSFVDDQVLVINKAKKYTESSVIGVVGRILRLTNSNSFVVQCGDGMLEITEYATDEAWEPRIGQEVGYKADLEVNLLKGRVKKLESLVSRMAEDLKNAPRNG